MTVDEFAYLRGAVARAQAFQQEVNEIVASTTDGDDQGPGGAAATASPGAYTSDEFDAFVASVWSLENDDPTRFDELLTAALAFVGRIAIDGIRIGQEQRRAAALLRAMEQRGLWGPDHPVRQP